MEGGSSQTIGETTKDDAADGPETDLVEGVIDVWEDQGIYIECNVEYFHLVLLLMSEIG